MRRLEMRGGDRLKMGSALILRCGRGGISRCGHGETQDVGISRRLTVHLETGTYQNVLTLQLKMGGGLSQDAPTPRLKMGASQNVLTL